MKTYIAEMFKEITVSETPLHTNINQRRYFTDTSDLLKIMLQQDIELAL